MVTAAAEHLQRYLADHEVACPNCRYNLHGVVGEQCPECGRSLVLSICDPSPLWRRRGLICLLLLWLVLAGTMNAVRQGRVIHRMRQTQTIVSQVMSPSPFTIGSGATIEAETITIVPPEGPVTAAGRTFTVSTLGQPPVSWTRWVALASWTVLALTALAGLIALAWYRRRPTPARLPRILVGLAWVGFSGYFAYHTYRFARELIG